MSTYTLTVAPPSFEDLNIKKPVICSPGPNDVWPSVQEALAGPIISHYCDAQYKVIDEIRAGLQYAFQTKSKLVFAVSGAGHSGMETVINNLVAPGETLLIAAGGFWDERAISMGHRYGLNVVVIRRSPYSNFTMEELEVALKTHRPAALFIVHGDSSTGTVQELSQLGQICHRHGALLLVDTVVSLGGVPFLMDEWQVDAVYAATQKALSGPAGIAPVAFSELAEKKIENSKHKPVFYFDVKLLADQWNCYGNTRTYHHTMCPPMLYALRALLREIITETLPACWARQARATRHLHQGLKALSVKFFVPKSEDRLDTVSTVALPEGYDYMEVQKYIRERHNVLVGTGLGPTAGKVLRIGIMGVNATEEVSNAVINAVEDALVKLKKSHL